ncbi:MAG: hypothetical protein PUE83_09080 [Lachnobacterium sp.]|nr:hypothetical protein [Lachnobacterium sp.]
MKDDNTVILQDVRRKIQENGYTLEENPFITNNQFENVEFAQVCLENQLAFLKENQLVALQTGVGTNSLKRKIINNVRQIAAKIINPMVAQQNGVNTNSYEAMLQLYAYIKELEKRIEELEGKMSDENNTNCS